MKRGIQILFFLIALLGPCLVNGQDFYKATGVKTDFFSSAPVEDIHAVSEEGISVLNPETGEISFQIKIRSFQFRKAKMQEHFNENFMESHKYPVAAFKGEIREEIDFSENGEHEVTISGILDIHGNKKKRYIPAKIEIKNGNINLKSRFDVACKDHDIEIPKILWKNIAEVVRVTVGANYSKI